MAQALQPVLAEQAAALTLAVIQRHQRLQQIQVVAVAVLVLRRD